MAIMKTLTVGTETYTVRDPEAVSFEQPQTLELSQQQRARENIGAISEKEMVDKLCSGFTESGAVVTCQPVEGYPLDIAAEEGTIITHCGKNLIDPVKMKEACDSRTTLDGDVFTTNFANGGIHINIDMGYRKYYPKGTYTFTFIPLTDGAHASLFVYAKSNGATIVRNRVLDATNGFSYTFTVNEEFAPCLAGYLLDGVYGTYSYKLQLEVGSTATEYKPYNGNTYAAGESITALQGVNTIYADSGDVAVAGRNDPVAIINKLTSAILSLGGNV